MDIICSPTVNKHVPDKKHYTLPTIFKQYYRVNNGGRLTYIKYIKKVIYVWFKPSSWVNSG